MSLPMDAGSLQALLGPVVLPIFSCQKECCLSLHPEVVSNAQVASATRIFIKLGQPPFRPNACQTHSTSPLLLQVCRLSQDLRSMHAIREWNQSQIRMCAHILKVPARSQAAQAIAGLILQHSAWEAAGALLQACALRLPAGRAELPARLEASLAGLEACAPTGQPQISASGTLHDLTDCQLSWLVRPLSWEICLPQDVSVHSPKSSSHQSMCQVAQVRGACFAHGIPKHIKLGDQVALEECSSVLRAAPLSALCHLLTSLMQLGQGHPASQSTSTGAEQVRILAVKLLMRPALACASSEDSGLRDTTTHSLLPVLGRTVGSLGGSIGTYALQALWEQCR